MWLFRGNIKNRSIAGNPLTLRFIVLRCLSTDVLSVGGTLIVVILGLMIIYREVFRMRKTHFWTIALFALALLFIFLGWVISRFIEDLNSPIERQQAHVVVVSKRTYAKHFHDWDSLREEEQHYYVTFGFSEILAKEFRVGIDDSDSYDVIHEGETGAIIFLGESLLSFEKDSEWGGEKIVMWDPTDETIINKRKSNLLSFIVCFSMILIVVLWLLRRVYVRTYTDKAHKR